MKSCQSDCLCVILLLLLQTSVSRSEKFQVLGSGVPVVVSPGEDTVLPCYLSPDISAEDLNIRWFRGEYEAPVCLYQSQKYNTDVQNPAYRERANLFLHELHRGNVSLKLRNVSLSDHGLYNCLVESVEHNGDTLIDLVVRDVSVSLHSPGGGQTQLLCRAEGWFPAPAVMWIDKNGKEVPSLPITEDSNSQGLLSIKSYIPVKQESNIFSCLVRSTQPMADWESELHIPTDLTLDPDTAYCSLTLSEDGKRVQKGPWSNFPDNPQRFDSWACVLSREGFSFGRHYWEVEVNQYWRIGVTRESAERKGDFSFSPQEGCWMLEYCSSHLKVHPKTLGVCVDIEKRKVSFYKVESKTHIYTFTDMVFNQGEKIYPVFWTWDYKDLVLLPPVRCEY
ncbi:butyrophilin subfamily 1 member A1-like isoform X4 [Lepisosteus oculatus]|uniref:butyrophilin subfamily 1 member A1-like isoform X4 n=1 Tax=Lepisosteus oculatus TaxID=7918 RepID=UPI003711F32E